MGAQRLTFHEKASSLSASRPALEGPRNERGLRRSRAAGKGEGLEICQEERGPEQQGKRVKQDPQGKRKEGGGEGRGGEGGRVTPDLFPHREWTEDSVLLET